MATIKKYAKAFDGTPYSRMFYYRGYATDVLETKTKPFVRKYIHNGKLLIKCDDKTYTVIGQDVK